MSEHPPDWLVVVIAVLAVAVVALGALALMHVIGGGP